MHTDKSGWYQSWWRIVRQWLGHNDFACRRSFLCHHWTGDHMWWTLIWGCRCCCCQRWRWGFRVGHVFGSAPMLCHLSSLQAFLITCPSLVYPSKKFTTTTHLFCLGNAAAASVVSQRERNKCEDDEKSSSSTKKGADVRNMNVCIYFIYSNACSVSGKILLNVNGWPLTRAWVVCSAIKKWILR
jgi:hypothetical protein